MRPYPFQCEVGTMGYTVSEVARLAKISVRTLHHYDEIGLLRPTGRSPARYRLYTQADLERLQHVLFFRELAFPLEEIRRILDDPTFDRREALRLQRRLLADKAERLSGVIHAVDAALQALEKGTTMSADELFQDFDPREHEEEAERRWGATDAYRESTRRTAGYGPEEWAALRAESDEIFRRLAERLDEGCPPDDARALALAEEHRAHVDRWFYPCSPELHRGLGELYVNDPKFTANLDRLRPGLARYVCDVFAANARQAGA